MATSLAGTADVSTLLKCGWCPVCTWPSALQMAGNIQNVNVAALSTAARPQPGPHLQGRAHWPPPLEPSHCLAPPGVMAGPYHCLTQGKQRECDSNPLTLIPYYTTHGYTTQQALAFQQSTKSHSRYCGRRQPQQTPRALAVGAESAAPPLPTFQTKQLPICQSTLGASAFLAGMRTTCRVPVMLHRAATKTR